MNTVQMCIMYVQMYVKYKDIIDDSLVRGFLDLY